MSQIRKFLILAMTLAVVAALGCSNSAQLESDVKALNERVTALEQQIKAQRPAAGPSPQLEQEAAAALVAVNQLVEQGKIDEAKAKLAADTPKYASTRAARQFTSMGRELSVVGKDSPSDWGIEKWFQGKDGIDLSGEGTTVVVFWESWCPHCRREVPKLQEMYSQYKDKGLQMIGVTKINRSATEQTVSDFLAQNNVKYPIAKEDGSLSLYFSVSGIPAAAVVKDGKVVWRGHPVRITEAMLNGWLAS